jgi:hypothetical protein
VSQWNPGLKKSIYVGLFVGLLIAIMRHGVYHSIDMSNITSDTFTLTILLSIALEIFVVLASLLCGYIMAATARDTQPIKRVFSDALIAGLVTGVINFLAMVLIYYPRGLGRGELRYPESRSVRRLVLRPDLRALAGRRNDVFAHQKAPTLCVHRMACRG